MYAFTPAVFGYIEATERSPRGEYGITDTIGRLLADGHAVESVEYDGVWRDVGRPWELLDVTDIALSELEGRLEGTVEADAHVGDSVLGADVNFGAGTVVANLCHDDASVRMEIKGKSVDTGRRKLGVGATTMPGESVLSDQL